MLHRGHTHINVYASLGGHFFDMLGIIIQITACTIIQTCNPTQHVRGLATEKRLKLPPN